MRLWSEYGFSRSFGPENVDFRSLSANETAAHTNYYYLGCIVSMMVTLVSFGLNTGNCWYPLKGPNWNPPQP